MERNLRRPHLDAAGVGQPSRSSRPTKEVSEIASTNLEVVHRARDFADREWTIEVPRSVRWNELEEMIHDAIVGWLASSLRRGDLIPSPTAIHATRARSSVASRRACTACPRAQGDSKGSDPAELPRQTKRGWSRHPPVDPGETNALDQIRARIVFEGQHDNTRGRHVKAAGGNRTELKGVGSSLVAAGGFEPPTSRL